MKTAHHKVIVIGGLNTDIIASGAKKLLGAGQQTTATGLQIGAGGKSRNIAQMIATLTGKDTVAMIGKTTPDPYGLWKLPITALEKAGVDTTYITSEPFQDGVFPGIALIPVDKQGRNQIYVIPGINEHFTANDIDRAEPLFSAVAEQKGILVSSLELPLHTAIRAVKKANTLGIKVLIDTGGIDTRENYTQLFSQQVFLLKPNHHETRILTGISVTNFETARQAANRLLGKTIENVFITAGSSGGYLFAKGIEKHIPIPIITSVNQTDETGAGDQTMAAIVAALLEGKTLEQSVEIGVHAGTLQFHRAGIQPLAWEEIKVL